MQKPHLEDEELDLVNILGLEPHKDAILKRLPKKAVITRPLTWAEMGFEVEPTPQSGE